jgi:hypothetical protein
MKPSLLTGRATSPPCLENIACERGFTFDAGRLPAAASSYRADWLFRGEPQSSADYFERRAFSFRTRPIGSISVAITSAR